MRTGSAFNRANAQLRYHLPVLAWARLVNGKTTSPTGLTEIGGTFTLWIMVHGLIRLMRPAKWSEIPPRVLASRSIGSV